MTMIEAEFHPNEMLLLPLIAVGYTTCSNPACETSHWRISLGWTVVSFHFYF